jgi:2-desacetyl-2-hydroxyethyl bacteriochlorophyllide A dehydrogenase
MRAAVFASEGVVEAREVSEPSLEREDDILVKVSLCGICGSDVRALNVPPLMHDKPGVVMGHEFVGTVIDAGPASTHLIGKRVVAVPNVHCGHCYHCRRAEVHHCDNFEHLGATTDGAFAELVVLPGALAHPLPDSLADDVAALAEPLACVLNATNRAQWRPGSPAVIFGAGPIGLLFVIVAKLAGAFPVIVSEPTSSRAEQARAVGADITLDPASVDVPGTVRAATDGLGAHVVIDAVGTLLDSGVACLRKGGQLLIFGLNEAAEVTTKPSTIVNRELKIEGSYITNGTFPQAIALLDQHEDIFRTLITDTLSLDRVAEGVSAMRAGSAIKVLIAPAMGTAPDATGDHAAERAATSA